MKTFKEFLEESTQVTESLIDKLEKFAGKKIKPGRVTIKGYPVDVADSDGSYIEMDAVDRAAAEGLVKALRKDGFNAKRVGNLGILIKESLTETKYELESAGLELMEQTQVNEAVSIDSQFMKMSRMLRDVKDAFNDVAREVKADTNMPARQYQSIIDKIEDHIELLRKELDKAQNELKDRY